MLDDIKMNKYSSMYVYFPLHEYLKIMMTVELCGLWVFLLLSKVLFLFSFIQLVFFAKPVYGTLFFFLGNSVWESVL